MHRYLLSAACAVALSFACGAGAHAAEPAKSICASPTQKVEEQSFVAIGGIEQWVTIKGDKCSNPVVLVLHGGPGNTMTPFADKIYAGWEKDFTLVKWDQRGAGLTYGKNRPDEDTPLTLPQMRDDGIELARYLTQRLGKRKVIIIGGSWSSILAVHMIKAEPSLFAAYLGSAQMVSYRDNPPATYKRLLEKARAANDADSIAKLEAIGAPPWTHPRAFGIMRRIDRKYEAINADAPPAEWWQPAPLYATPQAEADYEAGEDYSYINFVGFKGNGIFSTVDLPALGPDYKVPVFLLQGEEDILTLPEISRPWFDSLKAPQKQYILLPRVNHDPNQRLIDAQYKLLKDKIGPLAK